MSSSSAMGKPVAVAGSLTSTPGLYLLYKLYELKQRCKEDRSSNSEGADDRKSMTEKELVQLNRKIEKLLRKLDKYDLSEPVLCKEDECVVCMNHRATICTFPCGHRVVCRKCFVRTIQIALSQRLLPLRCVLCRAKIVQLSQDEKAVLSPPSAISLADDNL
ncbi:hypothetical protein HOLleu_34771 [Holothuria leucospilota]|uniref:RING-type domain-containing protein n=1 Tax=Holothuria leucospilota TaxID=206669 RepID=A0A9Q1BHD0_HOLLE|nr:hypothetical protein HOLleu_34771 [Holothuria leucospilota]